MPLSLGAGNLTLDAQGTKVAKTKLYDMITEYIGEIGVGTNDEGGPLWKAKVVFDTGSSTIWIGSNLCVEHPCDPKQTKNWYNAKKSTTRDAYYAGSGKDLTIHVSFGTGDMYGNMTRDNLHVGPVTLQKAEIAMVRVMTGDVFADWPFQGILGLGFSGLSHGASTYMDQVVAQDVLASNEFAFYFNTDRQKPSVLMWGGVDPDLYHGQIHMFPVVEEFYWSIGLVDFKIGNESMLKSFGSAPKTIIIDSGTTYFTAPNKELDWIEERVPPAKCKDVSHYPTMTFVLKDAQGEEHELKVSESTYMVADEYESCKPAWMAMSLSPPSGDSPFIIGEVFMRHFLTVFSRGDGTPGSAKVGFAPAKLAKTPSLQILPGELKPSDIVQSPSSAKVAALPMVPPAQKATAPIISSPASSAANHLPGMARVEPLPPSSSTQQSSRAASVAIDAQGATTNIRVPGRKHRAVGAVLAGPAA